jgi:RND family efflux transporter MFP subunit
MNRTRNAIIVIAALVAIIAVAVWAGHRGSGSAVAVKVQKIAYSTFTVTLTETGVVMNPTTVTVPTLVAGNIGRIYVKAGTHVTAGELLATIENPTLNYNAASSQADYTNAVANVSTARIDEQNARVQYQAQVATNRSALDEARRVYDADEALLAQKAIARSQVDADKAKLDQAQVAYDQAVAQLRLGAVSGYGQDSVQAAQADAEKTKIVNAQNQQQVAFTQIVAPMSGTVQTVTAQTGDTMRSLQSGDAVTAGQELFTIAADDRYVVKAQVDEQDIINVRLGQRANVTGQDFPDKTIVGHVSYIAPVAQKSSDASSTAKQILTTIALEDSPPYLKDGMNADVDILTTYVPHALVVRNDAILKDGKRSYVFVVERGTAAKRWITTGRVGDTTTVVTSGLQPGDVVVTTKDPQIKPGVRVTPMPSPTVSPVAT